MFVCLCFTYIDAEKLIPKNFLPNDLYHGWSNARNIFEKTERTVSREVYSLLIIVRIFKQRILRKAERVGKLCKQEIHTVFL
jgi:hypothetical protein